MYKLTSSWKEYSRPTTHALSEAARISRSAWTCPTWGDHTPNQTIASHAYSKITSTWYRRVLYQTTFRQRRGFRTPITFSEWTLFSSYTITLSSPLKRLIRYTVLNDIPGSWWPWRPWSCSLVPKPRLYPSYEQGEPALRKVKPTYWKPTGND